MKITLKINDAPIGVGHANEGKDLHDALDFLNKTLKGVEGVKITLEDASIDEMSKEIRERYLEKEYEVSGDLHGYNTLVKVKAVSESEALKKAEEIGISNPYINREDDYDYDDYDCDDECDCDCDDCDDDCYY